MCTLCCIFFFLCVYVSFDDLGCFRAYCFPFSLDRDAGRQWNFGRFCVGLSVGLQGRAALWSWTEALSPNALADGLFCGGRFNVKAPSFSRGPRLPVFPTRLKTLSNSISSPVLWMCSHGMECTAFSPWVPWTTLCLAELYFLQ